MQQKFLDFISVFTGARKTIVMIGLMLIGIIFRIMGYIDGAQFVDLNKGTVIAFFSANGLEHITTTVKEYVNSKGQTLAQNVVDVEEK